MLTSLVLSLQGLRSRGILGFHHRSVFLSCRPSWLHGLRFSILFSHLPVPIWTKITTLMAPQRFTLASCATVYVHGASLTLAAPFSVPLALKGALQCSTVHADQNSPPTEQPRSDAVPSFMAFLRFKPDLLFTTLGVSWPSGAWTWRSRPFRACSLKVPLRIFNYRSFQSRCTSGFPKFFDRRWGRPFSSSFILFFFGTLLWWLMCVSGVGTVPARLYA